jgi:hypothetical protein
MSKVKLMVLPLTVTPTAAGVPAISQRHGEHGGVDEDEGDEDEEWWGSRKDAKTQRRDEEVVGERQPGRLRHLVAASPHSSVFFVPP